MLDIAQCAQEIFEQTYLQPFSGQLKPNLHQLPVERITHGAQHASRVAAYIKVLVDFCREAGIQEALALQPNEITLIQVVGLCHDAKRQDEKKEHWECDSAVYCRDYLISRVGGNKATDYANLIILNEKGGFKGKLLQSADCLDIMRCKKEFYLDRVSLFKYFAQNSFEQRQFIGLAKEIMQLIAGQHDLREDCKMHMSQAGVSLFQLNKTRDPSNPWLKQAYEQAPNCYQKVTQDFQRFPLFSRYFDDNFNGNTFGTERKYLIKTIRADEKDFWRQFIYSITRSPTQQIRYDYREGDKKKYTVTGRGVYKRATKQPQYTKDQKQYYSQPQSTQIVTRTMQPKLFGFNKARKDKLVGVMLDIDDSVLLSDRLMLYDGGTLKRPYDFYIKKDATEYLQSMTQKQRLFHSEDLANFITACENRFTNDHDSYNEVLARIKWDINISKIVIGSDTLEARLLAQDRARTLRIRLKEAIEAEYVQILPDKYKIPIVFYMPRSQRHTQEYTEIMQQQDRKTASGILFNSTVCKKK